MSKPMKAFLVGAVMVLGLAAAPIAATAADLQVPPRAVEADFVRPLRLPSRHLGLP